MSQNVGSLLIDLQANVARLQVDMANAAGSVEGAVQRIDSAASVARGALAGIAGGLSVGAFAALIKGSIDAADELGKLSQKTGVAVESLSALKYAGGLSDVALDKLGDGLRKLNLNMQEVADTGKGDAAAALKSIGVSVTDASGQMRSADAVFIDVAEAFSGMKDGAGKTALAVDIFGKSGADLIPMLNAGRGGLEAMRQEAEALGVVMTGEMAKSAEEFNDNLTRLQTGASGLAVVVANETLPTLTAITQVLMETNVGGTTVAQMIGGALRTALETVAVVGVNVAHVFTSVGREIGAIAAQIVALSSLDLDGFNAISEAVREDGARARAELEATERRLLGLDRPSGAVGAAIAVAKNEAPKRIKAPASAPAEKESDFQKFAADAARREALLLAEAAATEKLSEAERWALDIMVKLRDGKLKLSEAEKQLIGQRLNAILVVDKQQAAEAELLEFSRQRAQEAAREYADIARQVEAKEREVQQIGLTVEALQALTLKRIDDQIAAKESEILAAEGNEARAAEVALIREQIGQMERLRALTAEGGAKARAAEESRRVAEEWQEIHEQITGDLSKSVTDALWDGFAGGEGAAENFVDTVKTMLKTAALRVFVQPVMGMAVGGMMNLLGVGGGGAAATAGGIGGVGNLVSAGNSAWNLAGGGMAGGFLSGMASVGSEAALGAAFVGPSATLAGGAVGAGAQVGSLFGSAASTIGAALPWIGAALAVASLFGGKRGGPKFEGSTLYDFSDDAFKLPSTVGGEDRDRDGGRAYAEQLTQATFAGVEATINALGGDASALAARFGFNRDNKGDAPQNIGTTLYKGGELIYQSYADYGREDAEFAKGVELELKRLTVAALGAAEGLPEIFGRIVDGIDLVSATSEQLDTVLEQLANAKTVLDYAGTDPFEAWSAAQEATAAGVMGVWDKQRDALGELLKSFDGSAAATARLAGGVQSLVEIEAQAVAYINQSIAALRSNAQGDAEGMYLGTLDKQGQYAYRQALSARLEEQLATAQGPEEVMALYERLRGNYQAAYGLLDESQRLAEGSKFFGRYDAESGQFAGGYLGDLQAQVEAMLAPFGQSIADAHDLADPGSLGAQIQAAFGTLPDSMGTAAAAMASAADSLAAIAGGRLDDAEPLPAIAAPLQAFAGEASTLPAAIVDAIRSAMAAPAAEIAGAAAQIRAAAETPVQISATHHVVVDGPARYEQSEA